MEAKIDIIQEMKNVSNRNVLEITDVYVDKFDGKTKYITRNEDGTTSEFTIKVVHLRTSAIPKP